MIHLLDKLFFKFGKAGGWSWPSAIKKIWKLLIDKDMKKKKLQKAAGISAASITKLGKTKM